MAQMKNPLLNFHRETLVDRLVQLLQESIYSGKYPPQMMISEAGVSKEFGVSRVPAREALQRLEEMNLIRKNHLRREIVKLSLEEFAQIYELKNVVEAFGAMKGSLAASPQEIEAIREVFNQTEQAIFRGDMNQLQYLNQSFHESLVFCCKNKKLIDTFLSLVKQVRWTTSLALKLTERPPQSNQEHRKIFDAFQERKADEVRALIESHTNAHMKRVLAQMESWE